MNFKHLETGIAFVNSVQTALTVKQFKSIFHSVMIVFFFLNNFANSDFVGYSSWKEIK